MVGYLLCGFALSFSSTVFAVKTLEDKGEYQSKYGQIAIGILIMQDIFAIVFLTASTGKLPSVWAIGLLVLIPMRYVNGVFLESIGDKDKKELTKILSRLNDKLVISL